MTLTGQVVEAIIPAVGAAHLGSAMSMPTDRAACTNRAGMLTS